jgi:putative transposase
LSICWIIRAIFKVIFTDRSSLVAENLALRQQLAVLQRNTKRPKLRNSDRIFWAWLSRLWKGWRSTLLIVQPETVVKWHRQGFKLYWRFKSRKRSGRPRISYEIRNLIRQMSQDNPTWGVPRIKSELELLGYEVAESTVPSICTGRRNHRPKLGRRFS